MSPISKTKAALQSMVSKAHSSKHNLFPQRSTREDIAELLGGIPPALNLTPIKQAVEDSLGYDATDLAPSLSIIPIKKILSLPWRAGEYLAEDISPQPDDDLLTASTRTITSQCAGNPRWECEHLAAFLRARNVAYDGSNTSIVVLARPNDPWKLEKENVDHAALMQVVGSLITAFARYVPEEMTLSETSRLTTSNVSLFSAHNNLDAGLAILSAFPSLVLDGKDLYLIIDLSDIDEREDGPSNDYRNLIKALIEIAALNRAILIRVEATKTGSECFIHGPGGTHQNGSKDLQVIYDPTEDKQ
ncbi:hypothetical protein F4801DRAFT_583485 [Xylaria longipes]|nr:hypothetical protein F4801DRAFT_583485 [Xylaria longipes]RYC57226.1 hypothetical protein CHU98_g8987 [Xylaria longipes]